MCSCEHVRECILLHECHFSRFRDTLPRHKADQMPVIPANEGAEAVDRRDESPGNQRCLLHEVRIFRVGVPCIRDPLRDPLAHLSRRRFCKRHNEKLIDIYRILFVKDSLHDPLDEYGRFAAARGSAHEDVPSSRLDDLPLFIRPIDSHAASSLWPLRRAVHLPRC